MEYLSRSRVSAPARVLVAAVVAVAVASASAASAVAASLNAKSVLSAATTAIAKQSGVHLTLVAKSNTKTTTEMVTADLGKKIGSETIAEGSSTITIKVTPSYVYVDGNSAGLTSLLGLSSADATKIGTNWLSIKAGTTPYTGLKSIVTISSIKSVLPAAKGTRLASKRAGKYILTWTTAATKSSPKLTDSLTVSATGATLPVVETAQDASGAKETTMFSNWGESVHVSSPSAGQTVAYTSLSS
jgi:hypothetical protein